MQRGCVTPYLAYLELTDDTSSLFYIAMDHLTPRICWEVLCSVDLHHLFQDQNLQAALSTMVLLVSKTYPIRSNCGWYTYNLDEQNTDAFWFIRINLQNRKSHHHIANFEGLIRLWQFDEVGHRNIINVWHTTLTKHEQRGFPFSLINPFQIYVGAKYGFPYNEDLVVWPWGIDIRVDEYLFFVAHLIC